MALTPYEAFANLEKIVSGFAKMADDATTKKAQEAGAKYFVGVMRKRSAPRSRRGRVHMLDTIDYEQKNNETVVGWTRFYGRLVESGHKTVLGYKRKTTKSTQKAYTLTTTAAKKRANTSYVRARPHMKPEFEAQRDEIFRKMYEVYEGVVQ